MVRNWFGKKKTTPDATDEATPTDVAAAQPKEKKKEGAFARLKRGLTKTREALTAILPFGRKLDEEALEDIEAMLIQADFGPDAAIDVTEQLRQAYKGKEFAEEEIVPFLKRCLTDRLCANDGIQWAESGPTVIIVAGVNGTGKTTSIAKLANRFHGDGKKVLLAAADTFRAAAVEQLGIWSDRIGIDMVRGKDEGDPASVVFDAMTQTLEGDYDVVIIDTAGRLHTQKNLMNQLGKMVRVIQKKLPEAPHEVLQVLDATTGQNAIQQAKEFHRVTEVSALVLTKLDGTARGGVIFPILDALGLPVKFIGVGEGIDDLQDFNPETFVDALFD
ncbi:MAG: signal recognition particle-docking protein FtsY [Planctomycetota bacterium]